MKHIISKLDEIMALLLAASFAFVMFDLVSSYKSFHESNFSYARVGTIGSSQAADITQVRN